MTLTPTQTPPTRTRPGRPRRWRPLLFALLLLVPALLAVPALMAQDGSTADRLAEADKHYAEKSFAKAAEIYEQLLTEAGDDGKFEQKTHCQLRLAQCEGQLAHYEKSMAVYEALIRDNPTAPITVEASREFAGMLIRMPHYYYKKDNEVKWGGWISGGTYHHVRQQSLERARSLIVDARALQTRLLVDSPATLSEMTRFDWRENLAALHLEEAAILELHERQRNHWENREYWHRVNPEDPDGPREVALTPGRPDGEGWDKVENQTFRTWPLADDILEAYEQGSTRFDALHRDFTAYIARQAELDDDAKEKLENRALGYLERAGEAGYRSCAYLCRGGDSSPESLRIVYGEKNWKTYDPIPRIDAFVATYAKHYRAPEALFLAASQQQQSQRFVESVALCDRLIESTPDDHPWSKTAVTLKNETLRPRIDLHATLNGVPGEDAPISARIRNIKELTIETWKFDLGKFIDESDYLNSTERTLSHIGSLLNVVENKDLYDGRRHQPDVKDLARLQPYLTKVGQNATHGTKDISKHRYHQEQTLTGLKENGLYLVRVSGNDVFTVNFVQITDRTLVCRPFSERRLFFLADRETGEPIEGETKLILKEYRWRPGSAYIKVNRHNMNVETGDCWHVHDDVPPRHSIQSITAIARCEDGQIIFNTGQRGQWWWNMAFRDSEVMGYTITDRPIYRPNQTVNFTSILRARKDGAYGFAPPTGAKQVWVTVFDSKGTQHIDQAFNVDEFGQIEGSLELGEEPALGSWRIYLRWTAGGYSRYNLSTHWFRVEEYRKPEFAVSVDAGDARAKVGSVIQAKVSAQYYFGAPVADADVKYRVFRRPFRHTYRFPGAFDWLYRGIEMWSHSLSDHWNQHVRYGQELVAEGTAKTDGEGFLDVKFPAGPAVLAKGADDPDVKELIKNDPNLQRFLDNDYQYEVHVEVTDAARRMISGMGTVKVTRQSFGLFSNYRNNFYRPKDRVEVELRAVTPTGKPVKIDDGSLLIEKVKRYWWADEHGNRSIKEEVIKEVETRKWSTDARGVVFLDRVWEEDGLFRLTFSAPDPEGGTVTHVNRLLIFGENSTGDGLRFNTLQVVPQKRFYAEGEMIRLVVLTSDEGMTAHTLIELGDGGVMPNRYAIRTLSGSATMIEFEATKDMVPNVFLTVTSVRNNSVQGANIEVFIPPVKEFLDVKVETDKPVYSPGEEATVTVTAVDSEGNPVDAQIAVSVADEAVYAIQEDTLADIRQHFYGRRRYLTYRVEHSQNQRFWFARQDINQFGAQFWWGAPEGPRNYGNGWFDRDHLTAKELEEIRNGDKTIDQLKSEARQQGQQEAQNRRGDRDGRFAGARPTGAPAPDAEPEPEAALEDSVEELGESRREMAKEQKDDDSDAPTSGEDGGDGDGNGSGEGDLAVPTERSEFKDTAFWSAKVRTGENGVGTIKFKWPDNLTTWRITARGATADTKVGQGFGDAMVTKNIIIRCATPRFFMESDTLVLSTIVNNRFEEDMDVTVRLRVPNVLSPEEAIPASDYVTFEAQVTVPGGGEARHDWPVRVHATQAMKITAYALTTRESDMVTTVIPGYRWGIEQFKTLAGGITDDGNATVSLGLPENFDADATWMRVGMTPTVATAALDAVPYLIEYPYGCIEQTMSRFMPAVVTRGTLRDMGIDLNAVQERRQKILADQWERGRINRFVWKSPVFDEGTLNSVISQSMLRIAMWQNGDGGWGWFKGFSSDPSMTAYVVHGLWLAQQNGIDVDQTMINRALTFLGKHFLVERNLHKAAFMAYALAPWYDTPHFGEKDQYARYMDTLYARRADFNHLSRAYFALALHFSGSEDRAKMLVSNMEDYAKRDAQAGTAYWATSSDGWWFWWNNALETNTAVLRALAWIDPQHKDIEGLARWVLNHRQGNRWESTKGCSLAILSLMDYARQRGELEPDYHVDIRYNGEVVKSIHVTRDNMLALEPAIYLDGQTVAAGDGKIEISKRGPGAFSYVCTLNTFNMSKQIESAGYEIFVEREYYKLIEKVENPDATDGSRRVTWDRVKLDDGAVVNSGDLIEVQLKIDSKNDYEYVLFEDMKPAGCETDNAKSGYTWADGLGVFIEFHDERVAMFASWVPQGKHTLTYRLRAEIPGTFHALPTKSEAMYAPLVRANAASFTLGVKDVEVSDGNE